MKVLKRFIYLGYYLKKLDWTMYWKFVNHVTSRNKEGKWVLVIRSFQAVFQYNISLLEYFQFHFYRLSKAEKENWAGTGFMYETILQLNPKQYRLVLSDKGAFARHYKGYIRHTSQKVDEWVSNPHNKGR